MRILGGLPIILSQIRIDDHQPFMREYALFAVRNLLTNNAENQALVSDMKQVDVSLDPALKHLDPFVRSKLGLSSDPRQP